VEKNDEEVDTVIYGNIEEDITEVSKAVHHN
jgi:hypothetical protein